MGTQSNKAGRQYLQTWQMELGLLMPNRESSSLDHCMVLPMQVQWTLSNIPTAGLRSNRGQLQLVPKKENTHRSTGASPTMAREGISSDHPSRHERMQMGVADAVTTQHGPHAPNTHNQGSMLINGIFLAPELIQNITLGYLAFGEGIPSNHWAVWIDILVKAFLRWFVPPDAVWLKAW